MLEIFIRELDSINDFKKFKNGKHVIGEINN